MIGIAAVPLLHIMLMRNWQQRFLRVPWREIPDELLADVEALLEKHPEPPWLDEEHVRVSWD